MQRFFSLKQVQHIAGKLNWASQVILPGRFYLWTVFEAMKGLKVALTQAHYFSGATLHFPGLDHIAAAFKWQVSIGRNTQGTIFTGFPQMKRPHEQHVNQHKLGLHRYLCYFVILCKLLIML